ncbi:uncharacterized protein BXZ73DRAFT_50390 [Epithele typhae]|uniref:uncharacterized protein n=1 Tax=Epithele typhae TaxID=378194 RepID=UPI0020086691|nr:uncharacterized protein BXZ73DRAFT_50390 [Epithele typhae]KAH9924652.1 hypothetical protein BXZ73DRAFT_50390 [Epithele typhae]
MVRIFSAVPGGANSRTRGLFGSTQGASTLPPSNFRNTLDLLPLTTVCRLWRDILLNSPALWTSLSSADPRWGASSSFFSEPERALHISRLRPGMTSARPLYIVSAEPIQDSGNSHFFRENGHRIEELTVTMHLYGTMWCPAPNGSQHSPPFHSLSFPPTSLKRLTLTGQARLDYGTVWQNIPLFDGVELAINSLFMHSIPFLPVNPTPFLTCLVLSWSLYDNIPRTGGPVRELLTFLSNTPSLQKAYIDGVTEDVEGTSVTQIVHLPFLRTLKLSPGRAAATVFSQLSLPPQCLTFLNRIDIRSGDCVAAVSTAIPLHTHRGAAKLYCSWDPGYFQGSVGSISIQAIWPEDGGGLRLHLASQQQGEDLTDACDALDVLLSALAGVDEVWLRGAGSEMFVARAAPQMLLRRCTAVKALHVHAIVPFGRESVPALWPPAHVWPALERLHVCLNGTEGLQDLAGLLRARKDAGRRVEELRVSHQARAEAAREVEAIRGATEAHVGNVEVGWNLYEQGSWDTVLPRIVLPAESNVFWPSWVGDTVFG